MSVLHARASVVLRHCVLRFPTDAEPQTVNAVIDAWNERFAENFPGTGYFNSEPEIEMFTEGSEVVACNAHYLYADTRFWKAVESSRCFTVDEPVLAVANA